VDESANKAGHGLCDDASFLYCFAGLARVGLGRSYVTSQWLLETLYEAAQQTHCYRDLVDAFAEHASEFFRTAQDLRSTKPAHKRLTVMFTGYTADDFIFNCLVSNFQDFTSFVDFRRSATPVHGPCGEIDATGR
jgi:hypothetical protein